MSKILRVLSSLAVLATLPGCGADSIAPSKTPGRIELYSPRGSVEVKGQIGVQAFVFAPGNWLIQGVRLLWSSDDTSVATVDVGGRVTGRRLGTVRIRATWEDVEGTIALEVRPASLRITLQSGPATMIAGEDAELKGELIDAEGGTIPLPNAIQWMTAENGVIGLASTGQDRIGVHARSGGLAFISGLAAGVEGHYALAVLNEPPSPDAPVHLSAFQMFEFQNNSDLYAYGPGLTVKVDPGRNVEIKRVEVAYGNTNTYPALCSSGRLTAGQHDILTASSYPFDVYDQFRFFTPQQVTGVALLTYATEDGKIATVAARGPVTLMGFPFGFPGAITWKYCPNAT